MLSLRQKKSPLGIGTIKNISERLYGVRILDHGGEISHTTHIFIDIFGDV